MPRKGQPAHSRGKGAGIRFLREHVTFRGKGCLTWPMAGDGRGYGLIGYNGRIYKAHRLMCELAHGPAPSRGHHAAHSCGRGHEGCVHPEHLSWKLPKDNMADAVRHGTTRDNAGRPLRKLTPEQVQKILALKGKKTQLEIGAMFGVSWRQIGKIHRGVSWKDGRAWKPGGHGAYAR